jgi:pSer/pThr/pTyr-binding forkhead associated (FHA) protein
MPASYQDHLLIIRDDKGEHKLALDLERYVIGRDPSCDIRLVSQFVSRHHAVLVRQPDESLGYRIVDGDRQGKHSANGLLINGRKLQSHILQSGDEIVFGPGVTASYRWLQRDAFETQLPEDPYDITLIGPNMVGLPEDENADLPSSIVPPQPH